MPKTMDKLAQAELSMKQLREQRADLNAHVLYLWDKLIRTDTEHPLHVKESDPHWHISTSVTDRPDSSAKSVLDVLYAADLELHFVWQELEDRAVALENERDLMPALDDASTGDLDGPALRTALDRVRLSVSDAARARELANKVSQLWSEAKMISDLGRVPASMRSNIRVSEQFCDDRRLLDRAHEIIVAINRIGKQTEDAGAGAVGIRNCAMTDCEASGL
ncbi:hypothetical protein ADL03_26855 [Nocardia sp. NRRL S-836]|nr:hypothetical protein ADL03_26855 [Nocardia sp. NRRL S-836]